MVTRVAIGGGAADGCAASLQSTVMITIECGDFSLAPAYPLCAANF
jgi:hypothetical protein